MKEIVRFCMRCNVALGPEVAQGFEQGPGWSRNSETVDHFCFVVMSSGERQFCCTADLATTMRGQCEGNFSAL
jgi:hypothetical protein